MPISFRNAQPIRVISKIISKDHISFHTWILLVDDTISDTYKRQPGVEKENLQLLGCRYQCVCDISMIKNCFI